MVCGCCLFVAGKVKETPEKFWSLKLKCFKEGQIVLFIIKKGKILKQNAKQIDPFVFFKNLIAT